MYIPLWFKYKIENPCSRQRFGLFAQFSIWSMQLIVQTLYPTNSSRQIVKCNTNIIRYYPKIDRILYTVCMCTLFSILFSIRCTPSQTRQPLGVRKWLNEKLLLYIILEYRLTSEENRNFTVMHILFALEWTFFLRAFQIIKFFASESVGKKCSIFFLSIIF